MTAANSTFIHVTNTIMLLWQLLIRIASIIMRTIRNTGCGTLLLLAVLLTSAKIGIAAPPKSLNTFLD